MLHTEVKARCVKSAEGRTGVSYLCQGFKVSSWLLIPHCGLPVLVGS